MLTIISLFVITAPRLFKLFIFSQGVAKTPYPQEVVVSTVRYWFRKPFVCVGFFQPLVIQRV